MTILNIPEKKEIRLSPHCGCLNRSVVWIDDDGDRDDLTVDVGGDVGDDRSLEGRGELHYEHLLVVSTGTVDRIVAAGSYEAGEVTDGSQLAGDGQLGVSHRHERFHATVLNCEQNVEDLEEWSSEVTIFRAPGCFMTNV